MVGSGQWDSSGGGVFGKADTNFWKMVVVPDRWYCSSFVLYYKEGSAGWASDFCTTDLPDIFGQRTDKTRQRRDKTRRNSDILGRKLA